MKLPPNIEALKAEAIEVARQVYPDSKDYRLQLIGDELCVHAYRPGRGGLLVHTGVFL